MKFCNYRVDFDHQSDQTFSMSMHYESIKVEVGSKVAIVSL